MSGHRDGDGRDGAAGGVADGRADAVDRRSRSRRGPAPTPARRPLPARWEAAAPSDGVGVCGAKSIPAATRRRSASGRSASSTFATAVLCTGRATRCASTSAAGGAILACRCRRPRRPGQLGEVQVCPVAALNAARCGAAIRRMPADRPARRTARGDRRRGGSGSRRRGRRSGRRRAMAAAAGRWSCGRRPRRPAGRGRLARAEPQQAQGRAEALAHGQALPVSTPPARRRPRCPRRDPVARHCSADASGKPRCRRRACVAFYIPAFRRRPDPRPSASSTSAAGPAARRLPRHREHGRGSQVPAPQPPPLVENGAPARWPAAKASPAPVGSTTSTASAARTPPVGRSARSPPARRPSRRSSRLGKQRPEFRGIAGAESDLGLVGAEQRDVAPRPRTPATPPGRGRATAPAASSGRS